MSTAIRLGAMAMAAMMVLSVATPVVASESADIEFSAGNTSFTVTVTHNGTPVNDTRVNVTPKDPTNVSYTGDTGLTDQNGTVTFDLPANETEVNISTTVNGTTTTVMATLSAAKESGDQLVWDGSGPFGQWLSGILRNLVPADSGPMLGQLVSEIVTANNPGSEHRSDKANPGGNATGPPEHAGNKSAKGGNSTGPPDHATNKSQAKGNSSGNGGNSSATSSDENGNGGGNNGGGNGNNGNNGQAKDGE